MHCFSNSTSFNNHHLTTWRSIIASNALNRSDELLTLDHLAEYRVFSVQMRSWHCRNEELRAVCVGTCVGHGEEVGAVVLEGEVFVVEVVAVD